VPVKPLARAIFVWAAILVFAICNGAVRDIFLTGVFGPSVARFLSGIILCIAIVAAAAIAAPWLGTVSNRQRWYLGGLWLALTLGFELAVGYAQHQSWERLLDAYTFQGGNLWPLVLLTTFVAPWVGARLRGVN
jgi:hypothetical protein